MFVDNIPHKKNKCWFKASFKIVNVIGAVVVLKVGTNNYFMNNTYTKKAFSTIMLLLVNIYIFAQDSARVATTTSTSVTSEEWYMQKWVWALGGVVLIIILLALFSGGSKRSGRTDKVIITKTVRTESDTD